MKETQIADTLLNLKQWNSKGLQPGEDLVSDRQNRAKNSKKQRLLTNLFQLSERLCANLCSPRFGNFDGSNVLKQQYTFKLIADLIFIVKPSVLFSTVHDSQEITNKLK